MRDVVVDQVPALALAVPVLMACLLLGLGEKLPRQVTDAIATLTAALVVVGMCWLMWQTGGAGVVSWIGGWGPPAPVGIVLVADPAGAGLTMLTATLMFCSLLFSWRYFESVEAHFHVLMLLFLTGMTGFALSGDLFTMFVFFELMTAVALALTGHKVEEPRSVQGAFNFGVINSLGAYLSLLGIGLLYARTGELNLAVLRLALARQQVDSLVVVAFVLVTTGFVVKAAVVPFHFWLADAHAVAPAPVCVLFSGVMAELGLYGLVRVHSVVFENSVPENGFRAAVLVGGVVTTLCGAVMSLIQRNIKRLLAYSTIAHIGLFLIILGSGGGGLSAIVIYLAGHAGIKGMLFLLTGVLLDQYGSVDEVELHSRTGGRATGSWLFLIGALALAGLPPLGPGLGKSVGEEALMAHGYYGFVVLAMLVSALTGGAVLRVCLHVHFGLGRPVEGKSPGETTSGEHEQPEVTRKLRGVPVTMLAAIILLLVEGVAWGVVGELTRFADRVSAALANGAKYTARVLEGPAGGAVSTPVHWSGEGVLLGFLSVLIAVIVALVSVFKHALPQRVTVIGRRATEPVTHGLHRIHSGHVGDYVAWLLLGVSGFAAIMFVTPLFL